MTWRNRVGHPLFAILGALRRYVSDGIPCIIAGGAVRDILLDRPVKDIDIYVPKSIFERFKERSRFFGQWENLSTQPEADQYTTGPDTFIHEVWSAIAVDTALANTLRGNLPNVLNFIVVNDDAFAFTRTAITQSFDFGLCMVTYDGNGVLYTTQFQHDADLQQFTLLNSTSSARGKILDHYMRLSQKYSGWPLVENPE